MHHIVIVQRKFIPNLGQSFDAKRQCSHTQITKFRSKLDRINEFHIDYSPNVCVCFFLLRLRWLIFIIWWIRFSIQIYDALGILGVPCFTTATEIFIVRRYLFSFVCTHWRLCVYLPLLILIAAVVEAERVRCSLVQTPESNSYSFQFYCWVWETKWHWFHKISSRWYRHGCDISNGHSFTTHWPYIFFLALLAFGDRIQ